MTIFIGHRDTFQPSEFANFKVTNMTPLYYLPKNGAAILNGFTVIAKIFS